MYDFIIQIILMLSFGAVVYIVATAIPRIGDSQARPSKLRNMIANIPLHKIDSVAASYRDKILRRAKVVVMKIENFINKNLNKDKGDGGLGGPQI